MGLVKLKRKHTAKETITSRRAQPIEGEIFLNVFIGQRLNIHNTFRD
jgi:hypothetical protein